MSILGNPILMGGNGGGGGGNIQPLSVTQNGTYTASGGVDGYSPVTVNVQGGGGDDPFALSVYIASSGTQWINTGYIVANNSMFEVVYAEASSQPTYPCLLGVRDSDSSTSSYAKRCTFFPRHGNFSSGSFAWGTSDAALGQTTWMYANTKKKYLKYKKGSMFLAQDDGNTISYNYQSSASASVTYPIYLFTLDEGGRDYGSVTRFAGKLYRCRIYEDDTLVHEYIPWQDNGVACLKDTVTGTLKYNIGTGSFVYGEDT